MAVFDTNLQFITIHDRAYTKERDSNVFKINTFGKILYSNEPKFPETESNPQPYVFIGDGVTLHTQFLEH